MIKEQLLKLPLFHSLNNQRRKLLESRCFDFILSPLITRLEKHPPILIIDTTNHCNARCVWCHNPDLSYTKGIMKQELFKKIIDDYSQYGGKVCFATFGEPFMDKNILKKIQYVRNYSSIKNVGLLTNALLLSPAKTRQLLNFKIDIEISLDELDKKNFEIVKQIDFDTVIKNILFLLEENEKSTPPINIIIRLKTLSSENDIKQSSLYKQLNDFNIYTDITPILSSDCIANWAGNFNKKKFFNKFFPESQLNGKYKNYNLQNDAPCTQLWKNMVVMWDGKVVMCCADMEGDKIFGDLNNNSISEIWNGENLKTVRKIFKKRLKNEIPLCKDCDLHQGWQYLRKYFNSTGPLYKNNCLK